MIKNLGINLVPKFEHDSAIIVKRLLELDVEWVRLGFDFYNFDRKKLDILVAKLSEAGIKILGLLYGEVPGVMKTSIFLDRNYSSIFGKEKSYLRFIKNIVSRYAEIDHWEIWNEPNSARFWQAKPSPQEYGIMLKDASQLLKGINPKNKIVFGGVAGDDDISFFNIVRSRFEKDVLARGIGDHVDIVNFHPYDKYCYFGIRDYSFYLRHFKERFKDAIAYSKTLNKPIWITEFGISRKYVYLKEEEIADVYFELYSLCSKESIPFFIWDLIGPYGKVYSRFNPELTFAVLDNEGELNSFGKKLLYRFKCA
ncbi:MAG: cellulase family glycosylhydrolase [Candidatus Woesearchaeota archaeon]|nr:cellulase family glycosylhydrolase [Candidatus Woesearchaeota archaeon]